MKVYRDTNVLDAAKARVNLIFDNFDRIYIAFSGGKDSSVMLHLVMDEAIKRNRVVGLMFIDFEAQYRDTIDHATEVFDMYADYIDPHWICVPMNLRNALTNYEPQWQCWEPGEEEAWVREKPCWAKTEVDYPFCVPGMEFEEFVPFWIVTGKQIQCGSI